MASRRAKTTGLFNHLMQRSKVVTAYNPDFDYATFDRRNQTRLMYGAFSKLTKDGEPHFFSCVTDMIYRQRSTGLEQKVQIKYIVTEKQSFKLTLVDLDCMAYCYQQNDIVMVKAVSTIRLLRVDKLKELIDTGKVTAGNLNVTVTYPDKKFEMEN